MPLAPVALGERPVGDMAHEVLQKAVLPVLRRARVGLDAEHLLADERLEQRPEPVAVDPRERRDGLPRERLAEHRAVL